MKANWVFAVTFTLVLSILAACTAPPAGPTSPPPPSAPTAMPVLPTATPVPPTAPPIPPTATPLPPTATPVPPTQAPALPTPLPELMDVVKAYEAAVNRGDASGIPALFPEQFANYWIQGSIMTNQKQLADGYAFAAALHERMKLEDCRQSQENLVRCSVTDGDDCTKAAGIPALKISVAFTIIDKKIKLLNWDIAEFSQADGAKYGQWFLDLTLWIRQERQAQRAKLVDSHGDYVYSTESGAITSQLCQEYAATLK